MSNAAKYRKRAVEFEQLKQFDNAVNAYVHAIDEAERVGEEVDVALYNKVGDLTFRLGRVPDAVTYYERAVESYAAAGLFNNAIALCNKILRNAPGKASVYFTLGRICVKKGLRGDASRNFLEYASRMRAENRTEEAMRALAEVAELMPELVEVRGLVEEHAARMGVNLSQRGTPLFSPVILTNAGSDLVFLDLGDDDEPPPPARPATPAAPARTFTTSPPVKPKTLPGFEAVMLFDPSAEAAEAPAAPVEVDGLETNGAFDDPGVVTVDGLTDVEPAGESLTAEEAAPLEALTGRLVPEAAPATADMETHAAFLTPIYTEAVAEAEIVDTVEGIESLESTPGYSSVTGEVITDYVSPIEDVITDDPAPLEVAARAMPPRIDPHDFFLPGALPPLVVPDSLLSPLVAGDEAPRATAAPISSPPAPIAAAAPAPAEVDLLFADSGASDYDDIEIAEPVRRIADAPLPVVVAQAVAAANARHDTLRLAVQREPEDWGLRQRFAEALIGVGDRENGIVELEKTIEGLEAAGDLLNALQIADQLAQVGGDRVPHHQKRVELALRLGDPSRMRATYLDLADALAQQGGDSAANAVYARVLELDPNDERARSALGIAAPPPPPPPAGEKEYVDLSDWLHDEVEPDTRIRMPEPVPTGNEQRDFDALLRHFKEGVARTVGEDDHDSHYDLGVAYKEMGLLDDAIGEFQKALRSRAHRLPAYEALGQCFVEQGRYEVAATVLSRALHEPGLDDGQRIGVLYLLGYSSEALQRRDDACSYFQRVYATDPNFRDVSARLAALHQVAQ